MKKTTLVTTLSALCAVLALSACARGRCCRVPGGSAWQPVEPPPAEAAPSGPASTAEVTAAGGLTAGVADVVSGDEAAKRLHGHRFQSLSCDGAKCGSVLEALARTAGVRVHVTPAARERLGTVSMSFQNVTLAEALDQITKAQGLAWSDDGANTVTIDVVAADATSGDLPPAGAPDGSPAVDETVPADLPSEESADDDAGGDDSGGE